MNIKRDEENELTNKLKKKFIELSRKIKSFLNKVKMKIKKRISTQLSEQILELLQNPT